MNCNSQLLKRFREKIIERFCRNDLGVLWLVFTFPTYFLRFNAIRICESVLINRYLLPVMCCIIAFVRLASIIQNV